MVSPGKVSRPQRTSRSTRRLERRNRAPKSKTCAKVIQVRSEVASVFTPSILTSPVEFDQYLSYVRNLGFEDTPDYDHLRELFTKALKNSGEVEDNEYDWMKINNGKGWEAMKAHPSHGHLAAVAPPGNSTRELHGASRAGVRPAGRLTRDRLDQEQPAPPSAGAPGAKPVGIMKARDRPVGSSNLVPTAQQKRQSAAGVGPPIGEGPTPTASTQAQFQASTTNLGPARMMSQTHATPVPPQNSRFEPEVKRSGFQKIMKAICCGHR